MQVMVRALVDLAFTLTPPSPSAAIGGGSSRRRRENKLTLKGLRGSLGLFFPESKHEN